MCSSVEKRDINDTQPGYSERAYLSESRCTDAHGLSHLFPRCRFRTFRTHLRSGHPLTGASWGHALEEHRVMSLKMEFVQLATAAGARVSHLAQPVVRRVAETLQPARLSLFRASTGSFRSARVCHERPPLKPCNRRDTAALACILRTNHSVIRHCKPDCRQTFLDRAKCHSVTHAERFHQ